MSLQDAAIAANRFGLGARPGELRTIAGDPRGWLRAQLTPEADLPAPLKTLPSTEDDIAAFPRWIASIGLNAGSVAKLYQKGGAASAGMTDTMMKGSAHDAAKGGAPGLPPGVSIEQSFVKTFGPRYVTALQARMQVATTTDRPYFERLVHFWSNHFTVSSAKPSSVAMPPSFERDVCRAHAVGKFRGMLRASCKHPAMLVYLDNYLSIGPNSYVAKHPEVLPAEARGYLNGLNENLAREILELHTLGVRSGYTQADVTSLARIITGWGVKRGKGGGQFDETGGADASPLFRFNNYLHEPGTQTLLGKTYNQLGQEQGDAALRDIAAHPATASHIATKLVRHFVADDPPPSALEAIARVFRDTDGDLHAVCLALIDLPEAWSPSAMKFKPPEDYLISAVRAMDGKPQLTGYQLTALLDRMGQKPWYAAGPNGWADVEGEWIGPDPIWKRIEWADAVAKGVANAKVDPAAIAYEALGPALTPASTDAIRRAESPAQGLAIFLVSPEFQRR